MGDFTINTDVIIWVKDIAKLNKRYLIITVNIRLPKHNCLNLYAIYIFQ